MSRKEEILNEVNNKAAYSGFNADEFIQGAEWADEHPRKGLIDIDEACEWLKIMVPLMIANDAINIADALIEELKKKGL